MSLVNTDTGEVVTLDDPGIGAVFVSDFEDEEAERAFEKQVADNVRAGRDIVVYGLKDRDGAFLYIGQTNHFQRRMTEHRRTSPWWHLVDFAEVIALASRRSARDLEGRLIASCHPRYNMQHACAPVVQALRLLDNGTVRA